MADSLLRSKHAFGSEANIDAAIKSGAVDAYDIIFFDEKKIGWVDKDGNLVKVEDKKQIVRVEELPVADGDLEVIYVFNNECYIWDGEKCVPLVVDVAELETTVNNLVTQMETKVDETRVTEMIEAAQTESTGVPVVEF